MDTLERLLAERADLWAEDSPRERNWLIAIDLPAHRETRLPALHAWPDPNRANHYASPWAPGDRTNGELVLCQVDETDERHGAHTVVDRQYRRLRWAA